MIAPVRPAAAPVTIVVPVLRASGGRGRARPAPPEATQAADARTDRVPRVPRVARMLALAHHWRCLIRTAVAKDQADLARLVGVTRARVTQVMDLLLLAPDIQEAVLLLPHGAAGRAAMLHRDVVRVAAEPLWEKQRAAWAGLRARF